MTEAQPPQPATAPKPAKEKPPALEDKPLADFIQQDYLPALAEALKTKGLSGVNLTFTKAKLPQTTTECWQVQGHWGRRSFLLAFPGESLGGIKVFACADAGAAPAYLEPFLSDERKITLSLLVFGVVQRLNGQKWLGWN